MEIILNKKLIAEEIMSNKAVTISLFGLLGAIFFGYFVVLNNVVLRDKPIEHYLNDIMTYVSEENWTGAQDAINELEKKWNSTKFILALNYAEADYSMFMEFIGRIKSSVKTKDRSQAGSDAAAALELWDNFIKVIPQP